MNEFHEFLLKESGISFTEAEFSQENDWIKQQLRREVYNSAFSIEDARRYAIEIEPGDHKGRRFIAKSKGSA